MAVLVFSTSAGLSAASSDYERYGSMAWSNARSNERANDYGSRVTANTNYNVKFSAAEIAAVVRGFGTTSRASETNWPPRHFDNESESAPRPPAPTEEEKNLASAKAGNVKAMGWLGDYYLGRGSHNPVALGWYEAAARAGDGDSMYHAYSMLMTDYYGTKNVPQG